MSPDERAQREWLRQWTSASVALAEQRKAELRGMSPERALAASESLLALGSSLPLSLARRTHSGLVEQQELLNRRLPR